MGFSVPHAAIRRGEAPAQATGAFRLIGVGVTLISNPRSGYAGDLRCARNRQPNQLLVIGATYSVQGFRDKSQPLHTVLKVVIRIEPQILNHPISSPAARSSEP